ncbi:hypothetical protein Tco_0309502 [Tanacetum coccineum]
MVESGPFHDFCGLKLEKLKYNLRFKLIQEEPLIKSSRIKQRIASARDRHKSYRRSKAVSILEFQSEDKSPCLKYRLGKGLYVLANRGIKPLVVCDLSGIERVENALQSLELPED